MGSNFGHFDSLKKYSRSDFLGLCSKIILGSGLASEVCRTSILYSQEKSYLAGKTMLHRNIPRTNEPIPVIGLGTWQTFDVASSPGALAPLNEVISEFLRFGGKVLDSSPMYGRAEEIVGLLSEKLDADQRNKLFLATKVWTRGEESGKKQIEESFRKMKAQKIDLFQIHNLLDTDAHIPTLKSLKEAGRIRYIGLTHFTTAAFSEMERVALRLKPDFIQIPYSILTRNAEDRILPFAQESGIAVLVNRPFEEGELFNLVKGKKLPDYFKEWDCETFAQAFLKYLISHPAVTCVLPATSKVQHLRDNIKGGFGKFPEGNQRKQFLNRLLSSVN
ncbi:aldo/keto reductase [Leptospira perolatii]|uniref:Aldo/keto reductase n=1 Tax=Leptospira perolatii TaxID=2023191 RepID=A0A2M9ZLP6_9LEPT|nr:aldo/keto reductase [Leptospira perolatii]PJZ69818.1 aldo/keto reductase [Leptospira perolatii]PJZ72967.1 aldo/keto reductase [Leptospira perolatii]